MLIVRIDAANRKTNIRFAMTFPPCRHRRRGKGGAMPMPGDIRYIRHDLARVSGWRRANRPNCHGDMPGTAGGTTRRLRALASKPAQSRTPISEHAHVERSGGGQGLELA